MSCVNLPYEIISHILVNFLYTEYHQKCFLISKKINSIVKTNDLIKEKHIFDNRLSMLKEDDNHNCEKYKTELINGWQKFYFYIALFTKPLYISIYQAKSNTKAISKHALRDRGLFAEFIKKPVGYFIGLTVFSVHIMNSIIIKRILSRINWINWTDGYF